MKKSQIYGSRAAPQLLAALRDIRSRPAPEAWPRSPGYRNRYGVPATRPPYRLSERGTTRRTTPYTATHGAAVRDQRSSVGRTAAHNILSIPLSLFRFLKVRE